MPNRTLIIRQGPRRFVVIEQNTETRESTVYPNQEARELGINGYLYRDARHAARESCAQRYRTIMEALAEHPEAERAQEYDLEGAEQ
jgi:hypothetical protein